MPRKTVLPLTLLLVTAILPAQATVSDRKVFTWISHPIDKATAEWLYNMHFTDICVRYISEEQRSESKQNLDLYGLTYWMWIDPLYCLQQENLEQLTSRLRQHIQESPSGNILIDDCHFLNSEIETLLAAVANVRQGRILLTFYAPLFPEAYDFRFVDVDLYMTPASLNETQIASLIKRAKTLGVYVWIWQGHGVSWHTVTEQEIVQVYKTARKYDLARLYVWMGDETDATGLGMYNSSLMNFPQWWPLIQHYNRKFRTAEYHMPIILVATLMLVTVLTFRRYRRQHKTMAKPNFNG